MNTFFDSATWWLFGLFILGQIIYILLKLDELNKASADFDSKVFFKKERFALVANIIIGLAIAALHDEWATDAVLGGAWVKVVTVFAGYTAQSSFKKVIGFINNIFSSKTGS